MTLKLKTNVSINMARKQHLALVVRSCLRLKRRRRPFPRRPGEEGRGRCGVGGDEDDYATQGRSRRAEGFFFCFAVHSRAGWFPSNPKENEEANLVPSATPQESSKSLVVFGVGSLNWFLFISVWVHSRSSGFRSQRFQSPGSHHLDVADGEVSGLA